MMGFAARRENINSRIFAWFKRVYQLSPVVEGISHDYL